MGGGYVKRRLWLRVGARALVILTLLLGATVRPAAAEGTTDLAVTIGAAPRAVKNGGHVVYTITVTNLGPDVATDVTVGALFPSDWTNLVALSCSRGAPVTPYSLTCSVGSLAAGESATARVEVEVFVPYKSLGRSIDVIGEATAATADPDSSNNRAPVTIKVIGQLPPDPE